MAANNASLAGPHGPVSGANATNLQMAGNVTPGAAVTAGR